MHIGHQTWICTATNVGGSIINVRLFCEHNNEGNIRYKEVHN